MRKAARVKKKKPRQPRPRNNPNGAGNYHSRMHRGKSAGQTSLALHEHAEQEKSAHAQSAREEEVQSVSKTAYAPSRNEVIIDATQNRQTPFRFPSRQSHHAAPQDRYRDRGDRLQKSRSPEKIRH